MSKVYLVPTPIGNLGDITLRALEVLKNVDLIAAEDTRQTLKLLNHFEIKKPLISYHKHNEQGKGEEILRRVKEGTSVAIVSDAGTPGISDPGSVVVEKCIEEGIEFEVLPGATAFTTALIYSGLDTTKFMFKGFFPRENKDKRSFIEDIKDRTETIIIYESPYRILDTLEEAKIHFEENAPKGEFVCVISGKTDKEIEEENTSKWISMSIEEHIIHYIDNEGMKKKDAIKQVAKDRGVAKSEIYKFSLDI